MAYSSTIPEATRQLLIKLKERYPDYHWTFSRDIAMLDGFYLIGSNDEHSQIVSFKAGVNVMDIADKIVESIVKKELETN